MTTETPVKGACPECGTTVPTTRTLIEYEKEGTTHVFAECPGCNRVVRPAPEYSNN